MRNRFSLGFIAVLALSAAAPAQRLWTIEAGPENYTAVFADTRAAHLTAVLDSAVPAPGNAPGQFISAAYLLAALKDTT